MKKLSNVINESKFNEKDRFLLTLNEGKVTSDKDFKEWAETVLKKAFGDKFDQDKANKTIEGLLKKYKDNYGAMIGALSYGLGEMKREIESGQKINEGKVTSDKDFKERAETVLKKAFGDKFDQDKANDTIEGLLKKYKGDYGAMVGALSNSLGKQIKNKKK